MMRNEAIRSSARSLRCGEMLTNWCSPTTAAAMKAAHRSDFWPLDIAVMGDGSRFFAPTYRLRPMSNVPSFGGREAEQAIKTRS